MKPSEMFEGPESSLRKTFENTKEQWREELHKIWCDNSSLIEIEELFEKTLTSRDTYWKERVRKEVEGNMEKWANIEHERWNRWQKHCHKILRENCPSDELEKVLERWDKQIATPYSVLSEEDKEKDREQVQPYITDILQALDGIK